MYGNTSSDRNPLETSPDGWPELEKRDQFKVMFYETFSNLSLDLQDLLILCSRTTLTHAQIATVCGCSQQQVYQGIKRARRNLLKCFVKNLKIAGDTATNSDTLARWKTIIEEELSTQIQEFFSDRIAEIYQSLDPEQKKSLAESFFSRKDN